MPYSDRIGMYYNRVASLEPVVQPMVVEADIAMPNTTEQMTIDDHEGGLEHE